MILLRSVIKMEHSFEKSHYNSSKLNFSNFTEDTNSLNDTVIYYFTIVALTVTTLTLICGAISWTLITKWRAFKNYVFLNLTLIEFIRDLLQILLYTNLTDTYTSVILLYLFVISSYNFWLLILNIMFHSDLVKIFGAPTKNRFLKSAAVGYGIPAVLIISNYVDVVYFGNRCGLDFWIVTILPCLLLITNAVLFVCVLVALFKGPAMTRSRKNLAMKVQVAILLLVMSGIGALGILVEQVIAKFMNKSLDALEVVLSAPVTPIVTCVCLFSARGNRSVWYDFYKSSVRKRETEPVAC